MSMRLAAAAPVLGLLGLLWSLAGCTIEHRPLDPADAARRTPPLPAEVAARFAYERVPLAPTLTAIEDEADWEKLRGKIATVCPVNGQPREVTFEFWRSKVGSGPRPLIVIVPILAGRYPECDYLGQLMARNGMHAFFVHREDNIIDLSGKAEPWETKVRRSVVSIRKTLDWASARPDVVPDHVGLVGISLGAMVGSIAMGVEPRIKRGVLLMGGGDIPGIAVDSIETPIRRLKIKKMRENDWSEAQFKEFIAKQIESDPILIAPYVGAGRVQQFVARYDNKVPTAYQWRLWEALGRPEVFDIPIGHYTAIFYIGFAERNALAFMKNGFAPAAPAPISPANKVAAATSSR